MDRIVMAYDDKLSLDYVWDSFASMDLTLDFKQCPSHIMTWVLEAWHDFLNQNGYPSDNSSTNSDVISESDNDSDWDDCGSPTHPRSPESQYTDFDTIDDLEEEEFNATEAPEHEFDLFNDVIEEEFPEIHDKLTSTSNEIKPTSTHEDANPGTASLLEQDGTPISFIIPPEGMRLTQLWCLDPITTSKDRLCSL
jgi:hypothetical protein